MDKQLIAPQTRTFAKLLGEAHILYENRWHPLPNDKRGALIAYLTYQQSSQSREQIAFLFWPDTADKEARRNLRQLINRLKALPYISYLTIEKDRLMCSLPADCHLFYKAIATKDWLKAIHLYQKPFCHNLSPSNARGFASWLEQTRTELEDAYGLALREQSKVFEGELNYAKASRLSKHLLDLNPLAEDVLQSYLRLAYFANKRDEAIKAFETFEIELETGLGLEPLEETQNLIETIKQAGKVAPNIKARASKQLIPLTLLHPPKLVGRQSEIARVRQKPNNLVLISGEAGVGKSRFMTELAPNALLLRCQEGLENIPYYPATSLIKNHLEQNTPLPNLGPYLEDLVRLIPEAAPNLKLGPTDPSSSKIRLLEALSQYLTKASAEGSFQLAFDDLQWADPSTLELLNFLNHQNKVTIIANYRKHEITPQLRQTLQRLKTQKATLIELEPINQEATQELLASLMTESEGPAKFSQWLHKNTGGNPMFMLETLKSLFESGDLHHNQTNWHSNIDGFTEDYSELRIPRIVTEIIERRTQKLSNEAQRCLQLAAVMGKGFTPKHLSEMAGLSLWAIMDVLEQTEVTGMTLGESFTHDLIRQTIYQKLPNTKRQLLHERVALQLTATEAPEVVAEHWYEAGNLERALVLWEEVIDRFRKTGQYHEATLLLERLVQLELTEENLFNYKCDLIMFYTSLNCLEKSEFYAKSILKDLKSRSPLLIAKARLVLAGIDLVKGKIDTLESNLKEINQLVKKNEFNSLNRDFIPLQIRVYYERGQFEKGLLYCQNLLEHSKQLTDVEIKYELLNGIGMFNSALGNYHQALDYHLEALEFAKEKNVGFYIANTALNLLVSYTQMGHLAKGVPIAEEALTLGYYECTDFLRNNLAAAYVNLERNDDALKHLKDVTKSMKGSLRGAAWARIAVIHHKCNRPEIIDEALMNAFNELKTTEVIWAHAQVVSTALKIGSTKLIQRGLEHAKTIDKEKLPKHIKRDFEQSLAHITPA